MAQDGKIGKNGLDVANYGVTKPYHRTTQGDETSKYRVNSLAARDALITNQRIDIGHIIYFDNGTVDSFHRGVYFLDEYPTNGDLTGVVWSPLGKGEGSIAEILELKLSSFVPENRTTGDLIYLDIDVNGNELSNPSIALTSADIGRVICIKKAHQNPDTADGSEMDGTQIGRLVTATAIITAVDLVNQTATIDKTLNQTGTFRAYKFYNFINHYREAIQACYDTGVASLNIDLGGIIGLNTEYETSEDDFILLKSSAGNINIFTTIEDNSVLKWCVENRSQGGDMYLYQNGNGDIRHFINILPPDEYTSAFGQGCTIFKTETNNHESVRTIQIENIESDSNSTDGADGHWEAVFEESGGGNLQYREKQKVKYQNLIFKNINTRLKNGGISVFNNNSVLDPEGSSGRFYPGNNKIHMEKCDFRWWSTNYRGENGRDWIDTSTRDTVDDTPIFYKFGVNPNEPDTNGLSPFSATVLNGQLTINTSDFSWYDYTLFIATNLSRAWTVVLINANGDVFFQNIRLNASLSDIVDAKTYAAEGFIGTAFPDGEYVAMNLDVIGHYGDYYGHPTYIHPHQDIRAIDIECDKDIFWWHSGGYKMPYEEKLHHLTRCNITNMNFDNGYVYVNKVILDDCNIQNSEQFYVKNLTAINSTLPQIDEVWNLDLRGECTFYGSIVISQLEKLDFLFRGHTFGSTITFKGRDAILHDPASNTNLPVKATFVDCKMASAQVSVNAADGSEIIFDRIPTESYPPAYFGKYYSKRDDSTTVTFYNCYLPFLADFLPLPNSYYLTNKIKLINSYIPLRVTEGGDQSQGIGFVSGVKMPVNDRVGNPTEPLLELGHPSPTVLGLPTNTEFAKGKLYATNSFSVDFNNINIFKPYVLSYDNGEGGSAWEFRNGGMGIINWYQGEIFVKVNTANPFNPFRKMNEGEVSERNTLHGNIKVKTLERTIGEVIRFSIDHENGILYEEDSTHRIKEVDAEPTRDGIDGEIVKYNGIHYKHTIQTEKLVDDLRTVNLVSAPFYSWFNTYTGLGFSLGEEFTIGQEFYERGYKDFSFALILDDDSELVFTPYNLSSEMNGVTDKNLWIYQALLPDGDYLVCYVTSKTGGFNFIKVGAANSPVTNPTAIGDLGVTLKATDNFKITATKIISRAWDLESSTGVVQIHSSGDILPTYNSKILVINSIVDLTFNENINYNNGFNFMVVVKDGFACDIIPSSGSVTIDDYNGLNGSILSKQSRAVFVENNTNLIII